MFSPSVIDSFSNRETPFYHYDMNVLNQTLSVLKSEANQYGYHVHYALKANSNNQILSKIKEYGFGADCVSGNEILKALEIGFNPNSIAFAGVGKSDKEINIGLSNDIFSFNCESIPEIEVINELAAQQNKTARIALRINPNVNANTHHYITTGLEENKFGINAWEFDKVLAVLEKAKNIKVIGLHFHVGSQITDMNVFKGLCLRVNEIQQWFYQRKIVVEHINVGGGLGISYEHPDEHAIPNFSAYFGLFNQFLELFPDQQVHFELGRAVVANCGNLISKVLYVKEGVTTKFAIVDAGMTELLRPALYQATHKIENLSSAPVHTEKYDVVGPVCESSDCFGKAIVLPTTKRGDIIAIRSAGAYGEVMANGYNLRSLKETLFT